MLNILHHAKHDWIKLIDSSLLSPEEFFRQKGDGDDGDKPTDGDDDFFEIKNMETSESWKDRIDLESLKKWEDEEMLDSIRHLIITGEKNSWRTRWGTVL